MMAIGSDFWRSTASSLAFTLSSAKIALFIEEMLDGGLEIGAWLRADGGGITDGRPDGGGIVGVFGNRPPDRIESGPGARLEGGGADGGGSVGRLEVGIVSRLEGGLESGEMSPRGTPLLSFVLISGSSPDH
jgi:hypothetical protein